MEGKGHWENQRRDSKEKGMMVKCLFLNKDSWGGQKANHEVGQHETQNLVNVPDHLLPPSGM